MTDPPTGPATASGDEERPPTPSQVDPTADRPAASRWSGARRVLVTALAVLVALVAAMVAAQAARASDRFGPVEVTIEARAAVRSETRLSTVLGDQVLDRHLGPHLTVRVDEIAVEPVLAAAVSDAPVATIRDEIEADRARTGLDVGPVTLRRDEALVARFAVQLLGFAGAAAFLTSLAVDGLLRRRGHGARHPVGRSLGVAALAVGGLAVGVFVLRDPSVDERTGWLAYGADRADVLQRLDEYDERYARTGRYVLALLESVQDRPAVGDDPAVCLVVASDVHSRNVYPLLASTVDAYSCTVAVIDAGDFVDWGEEFESSFFSGPDRVPFRRLSTTISDLGVPYLVVRGNHDSDSTMAALRDAGARELEGDVVEVGGLRIVGRGLPEEGDPDDLFTPDDGPGEGRDRFERAEARLGRDLASDVRRTDPDVAVVHLPRAAEAVTGLVPVVVNGHTHRQSTDVVDGTFRLDPGSVGGAGLRSFDNSRGEATRQQWAVLKFDRRCRLIGTTLLSADSLGGGDIVAREVAPPEPPGTAEDAEEDGTDAGGAEDGDGTDGGGADRAASDRRCGPD